MIERAGEKYKPMDADELESFRSKLCRSCKKEEARGCELVRDFVAPMEYYDENPDEWTYNQYGNITCSEYDGDESGSIIEDRCPNTLNLFAKEKK